MIGDLNLDKQVLLKPFELNSLIVYQASHESLIYYLSIDLTYFFSYFSLFIWLELIKLTKGSLLC